MGDSLAIDLSGIVPQPHAQPFYAVVLRPNGSIHTSGNAVSPLYGLHLPLGTIATAGNYTVSVDPSYGAYGTARVTLKAGPVLTTDDLLETVFDLTQNLENSWNTPAKNRLHRQWAMRSSMVGDVFCIRSENKFWIYLVAPVGFILLDASSLDELGSVLNSDEAIKQAVAKDQQEKAAS